MSNSHNARNKEISRKVRQAMLHGVGKDIADAKLPNHNGVPFDEQQKQEFLAFSEKNSKNIVSTLEPILAESMGINIKSDEKCKE